MSTGKIDRLNTIITVREDQKKKTTRELMQISREKTAQTEQLNTLQQTQQDAYKSTFTSSRTKAGATQMQSAFLKRLSKEITSQEKKIETIEQMESQKREELVDRVKAKNVVEKLQGKLIEEHQKDLDRKEQTVSDAIGQRISVKQ